MTCASLGLVYTAQKPAPLTLPCIGSHATMFESGTRKEKVQYAEPGDGKVSFTAVLQPNAFSVYAIVLELWNVCQHPNLVYSHFCNVFCDPFYFSRDSKIQINSKTNILEENYQKCMHVN